MTWDKFMVTSIENKSREQLKGGWAEWRLLNQKCGIRRIAAMVLAVSPAEPAPAGRKPGAGAQFSVHRSTGGLGPRPRRGDKLVIGARNQFAVM